MLDCNYQLKNTVLEKEKGNSIISKIMESLKGLNVTTAEFLLEESEKGNLPNSKDLKCTFNNFFYHSLEGQAIRLTKRKRGVRM